MNINIEKSVEVRFNQNKLKIRNLSSICLIILHHRGGVGSVESIHQQHIRNGWAGIGYNYYIRFDGKVYEGRPLQYIPSHCANNNSKSIGICLEGDFRKQQPTKLQMDSLRELIKELKKDFPAIKKILNHNDLYVTQCPVINLKGMV